MLSSRPTFLLQKLLRRFALGHFFQKASCAAALLHLLSLLLPLQQSHQLDEDCHADEHFPSIFMHFSLEDFCHAIHTFHQAQRLDERLLGSFVLPTLAFQCYFEGNRSSSLGGDDVTIFSSWETLHPANVRKMSQKAGLKGNEGKALLIRYHGGTPKGQFYCIH